MRNYGHGGMLDDKQVEWIIRKKIEGGMKNEDIARAQNVSVRWVQHLFSQYRRTGAVPSLKKPGRRRAPGITESERAVVLSFYREFRMCACYLEQVLLAHNIRINHKRIHRIPVNARLPLPVKLSTILKQLLNADVTPLSILIIVQIRIPKGQILLPIQLSNQPVETNMLNLIPLMNHLLPKRHTLSLIQLRNLIYYGITSYLFASLIPEPTESFERVLFAEMFWD